ncbi:hypothetical protein ACFWDI_26520 [Streptomyces sp. NPDC060064]|uniref:hypothetical protein n=1 Tax=Streptomyces sp. NPDC060064 TaxID=3347049 RepID=UPI003673910A
MVVVGDGDTACLTKVEVAGALAAARGGERPPPNLGDARVDRIVAAPLSRGHHHKVGPPVLVEICDSGQDIVLILPRTAGQLPGPHWYAVTGVFAEGNGQPLPDT